VATPYYGNQQPQPHQVPYGQQPPADQAPGPLTVRGHNGTVIFDGQWVTIARTGFLARASVGKGEKRLHISQITAVQVKPAGPVMNGFIQFTVPGGVEVRSQRGSQTRTAAHDENSVIFTYQQRAVFEQLRQAIEQGIAAAHMPQQAYAPPPQAPSPTEEIGRLHQLLQAGALTEAEFQHAKNRILGL